MSTSILIIGESGTGKSTSIQLLDPAETFILAVVKKPLPFKHAYKKAVKNTDGVLEGNYSVVDQYDTIISLIQHISKKRPEIKTIIIDDFQYIMANEFMRSAQEKGYQKFTDIAAHTWEILNSVQYCRDDLNVFMLTHSQEDNNGKYKAKTIGKMLDEKISLEGLFTVVLHTLVIDGKHVFLTQNDGTHLAKSPVGMFPTKFIPNDLQAVKSAIDNFYTDIPQ